MQIWTVRLGMSLMVMGAFWLNPALAQEQILVVPEIPYEPERHPYTPAAFGQREQPAQSPYLVHRALNKHGMGCQTDPYYPLCAGWRYEANFIFGSCRSFFGESCPPNQPCAHRRK
jgi:hypothetical protein